MKLAMAQINPHVGAIEGNTLVILKTIAEAKAQGADLVIFPELTLTGYPPEDLLLRPSLKARVERSLEEIALATDGIAVVVGYPRHEGGKLYNAAGFFDGGQLVGEYFKQKLPNYQVFDEHRYFTAGSELMLVDFLGVNFGVSICEDIWHHGICEDYAEGEIDVLINLSASPFHQNKQSERIELLQTRAKEANSAIVYVNQVGGQDELVFDGGSLLVAKDGEVLSELMRYEEQLAYVDIDTDDGVKIQAAERASELSYLDSAYQALVVGVRDYVNKNGFPSVVLGLSGGIDSALTLAIAVDALGAERVSAVMMPFRYTSEMSIQDAAEEANTLGVDYQVISIEGIYDSFMKELAPHFAGREADTTEQNLQARARGVLLMALSNKNGSLVLTTGNKSEVAVGYSTLYGDMAGGFDVLKDVPKTLVFELSAYRNTISPVIPQRVIDRPPSAELAPDQKDEDNLPSYDILDQILYRYIDCDESRDMIIAAGFDPDDVHRVIRLVDVNEYKRRQAPIGVRISQRGFGRDRRYPITNGWKPGI
ncbi:MAG: NAD+ synthase [Pseudomonadales bacterium]|jgi:NAD+ synthase (glutamine-hydrolysing)